MQPHRRTLKFPWLALVFAIAAAPALAEPPSSFTAAKRALYTKVYQDKGTTFYTGCPWQKRRVDLSACGLADSFGSKWSTRAKRTEAEHIIPASWLYRVNGRDRPCVSQAKAQGERIRDYCQEHDDTYRAAHNDLVNLVPAIGAVNGLRSNKPFADRPSGDGRRSFRGERSVTMTSRVVIPDATIRGDIARIADYMSRHYGVTYSARQRQLFAQWQQDDPISDEERYRCEQIRRVQGWCVFD